MFMCIIVMSYMVSNCVRATLCSMRCMILAKEIQSFYKYKQQKYTSTTNLAKEIWRENSKDSPVRGLHLYTVLHEADTYNGPVGTHQTMGTHCGVQAWGEWGSWISPARCEEVSKCSKWVPELWRCFVGFKGVSWTSMMTLEAYCRMSPYKLHLTIL